MFEQQEATGLLAGRHDDVAGHGPQPLAELGGQLQLGQDHRHHRMLPFVEQGQQQTLLRTEVVVHRSRGAVSRFRHRVHRDGVHSLFSEQLGSGLEQLLAGLGLALPLSGGHLGDSGWVACRI